MCSCACVCVCVKHVRSSDGRNVMSLTVLIPFVEIFSLVERNHFFFIMFRFKSSNKNKRKPARTSPTPISNTQADPKLLYNIPSVSQIAPLPQNKSHGILPVLSMDGRDAPNPMQLEGSDHEQSPSDNSKDDADSTRQPVGYKVCQEIHFIILLPHWFLDV